jgi:UDP-N-acetylglucosamine 4-epimerase
MSTEEFYSELQKTKRKWLVTGCAGFIGTNLVKKLLELGQEVVGLDNFATGLRENITHLEAYTKDYSGSFDFIEGDITNKDHCLKATSGVNVVLHQAALGSVPRSIELPLDSHNANVTGFMNMIWAAKENKVTRFVYASSSSVYGDEETLPKVEDNIGNPLSPYAATKFMDEVYADVFARCYGIETVGLRYFNVFGPHQQPDGPYAAVIPKWIGAILDGNEISIYGDGETSRDFCYIDNVVQMNLRCGLVEDPEAFNTVYNVAVFQQTSLNELFGIIRELISAEKADLQIADPNYQDFRPGDVRHSLANIEKAKNLVGFEPKVDVLTGLKRSIKWYIENHKHRES